jgi:cellulose synthase/poly-beta-1,6-N-acetylglucosamine synthase-like glycosyltransferase
MIALSLLLVPAALACGYLLLLVICSFAKLPAPAAKGRPRFDVVVPAHDEEEGIGETVASLLSVDYPRELFRVLVVADNCTDSTAANAAAAGAEVLVRTDPEKRGKGYALDFAFSRVLAGPAEAAVVVDADTVVSQNLLLAFAAALEDGARAAQADYAVRNPDASWRTRLLAVALGLFHAARSRGREKLGVSCGLRGNGMCFSREALLRVPHRSFSVVEDVEYGIRLGEAGIRVRYAGEAHVYGQMVAGEKASRSQRRRWESGRTLLLRQHGLRLLGLALRRRDKVLFDLALDVLVPPLSIVAAYVATGLVAALVWSGAGPMLRVAWVLCAAAIVLAVLRGWQLSHTGARGLVALLAAPFFVVWKLLLMLRKPLRRDGEWVRTMREKPSP